jgi:hypothetical protein
MNNKIILIESQPSLTLNYYPGSITLEGKEFCFEVREADNHITIEWANSSCPGNFIEIEEEIIEIFTKGR